MSRIFDTISRMANAISRKLSAFFVAFGVLVLAEKVSRLLLGTFRLTDLFLVVIWLPITIFYGYTLLRSIERGRNPHHAEFEFDHPVVGTLYWLCESCVEQHPEWKATPVSRVKGGLRLACATHLLPLTHAVVVEDEGEKIVGYLEGSGK